MLLSRPAWYNDESAVGYLIRLTEANGYRHPRYLLHMARTQEVRGGIGFYVLWLNDHDDQLASLVGLTAAQVQAGAADKEFSRPGLRYLTADKAGYCPHCLQEAHYWRVAWEYVFCVYCPRHRVLLRNRCQDCGELIPVWRRALNRCSCGSALSGQGAESLLGEPDRGLLLANALLTRQGCLLPTEVAHAQDVVPFALQHLSPEQLHQLVFFLGSYATAPHLQKPRKVAIKVDPQFAWRLLTAAASLLEDWPRGFHRFLARQLDENTEGSGLRKRFGYLYTAIYREFLGADFDCLREAFEDFLQSHWDEVLSGRNRRLSEWLKQSQGFVPASVAMRLFKVPRHVLENGIKEGAISGVITLLPSGRQRIVVAKTDLPRITSLWDWMDLKTAGEKLGLPERRVLELLAAGTLKGHAPAAGETWKIQRQDVEQLLTRFRESALDTVMAAQGLESLSRVLRHYLKPDTSFISLLQALLEGIIPYEWRSKSLGLAGIWLDKLQLKIWLQPEQGLVGVPRLAALLAIKQEVAYHLVRRQLIKADTYGHRGQMVSLDEIQRFRTEYVLARDLAQMLRTSPKSLIHRLAAAGLVPVTGPGVDECRQVIYRRVALAAVPLPASVRRSLDQLAGGPCGESYL